jgi:hypothetical protein
LALPLLLMVLVLAPPARGEEEPSRLDVSRATVLVSPGGPAALAHFLPSTPRPLTWPLPAGPLVVLGLPLSDPLARDVASAFSMPVSQEDLAGGYRVWAWHDGRRPLAFVFAADPAALHAARFEFDADAPGEMTAPDMRSLDFRQPDAQAACMIRTGARRVVPRYRVRALWADDVEHAAPRVAGVRGNRMWLEPGPRPAPRTAAAIAELRTQGVTPVIVHRPGGAAGAVTLDALRSWQAGHGVQHFALVFEARADRRPDNEADLAREVADGLRPGGLEELVVVPRWPSDAGAAAHGGPPDLRAIPEAVLAWSGPHLHSMRITRADAERRVRAAGVPVVLCETWAAPFQGEDHADYLPVAPSGRAVDLPEVLDGIVVVGARGTSPILAAAWAREAADPLGAHLLGPLLPVAGDAAMFLADAARALEAEAAATGGLVPWMRPLAATARRSAAQVAATSRVLGVPVVPAATVLDGGVDEAAWSYAQRLPTDAGRASFLVLSDGHALHFALRSRRGEAVTFAVACDGRPPCEVTVAGGRVAVPAAAAPHVRWAHRHTADREAYEIAFDRFVLDGDAHPLRAFRFTGPDDEATLLVVTR